MKAKDETQGIKGSKILKEFCKKGIVIAIGVGMLMISFYLSWKFATSFTEKDYTLYDRNWHIFNRKRSGISIRNNENRKGANEKAREWRK